MSDEFVDEMRARYGEDSNAFRIRVLGEFPMADDDTIIPFHLVESAIRRDIEVTPDEKPIWGLDVALALARIRRRCASGMAML